MNSGISLRRVVLTLCLTAWLGVQFLVVGVTPAWGFILPHSHLTRGVVSDSAWQAHLQQHRRGVVPRFAVPCDATQNTARSAILASLPDDSGALSFLNHRSGQATDPATVIPAIHPASHKLLGAVFHASDVRYAPPERPPII